MALQMGSTINTAQKQMAENRKMTTFRGKFIQ